jgi:hypothetical protein
MDSRESSRCTAPLAQRVAEDADSREIADAMVCMWSDVASALQSVVGRRGVAALFRRTLHLTAARHPWLAPLKAERTDATDSMAELATLCAAQPPAVAMEAGNELFTTFRELLTTLIGARLSERLLHAAWSTPSSAPPEQDPSP